ncbi:MAG: NUDIX hydrolase [Armatimonadota bacterium]|nr:NUDIX hydrolase [Armatimonadota bacterium]
MEPLGAEPTVGSRLIYRGRVVTLRVDEVRGPGGRIGVREIVEHPGAAAIVAVTDQDEVVFVRQYRKAVETTLLEIPAGTLEPGETPLDCARRELAEETGLQADAMTPMVTFVPSPGVLTEQITVFLARGLRPAAQALPEEEEGLHTVRVPLGQIPALIDAGEVRDAKTLIGLLLLTRR